VSLAISRGSISRNERGDFAEKTVGVKTPEWELEEHRLFGSWIVKVLVERQPAEGWGCVKVVSECEDLVCILQARREKEERKAL
jgi:hypothetical protein